MLALRRPRRSPTCFHLGADRESSLYNARRKLDASNSRHAITKAILAGLIEPGGDSSSEKNFRPPADAGAVTILRR